MILFSLPVIAGDQVSVKSIHLKGLKNINKFDVLRNVKTSISGGMINIDLDSLKSALDGEVMIDNYILKKENNVLVVDIIERYPLYVVVFSGKGESVPCLVDSRMRIIKSGFFFMTDMPIIEVKSEKTENEKDFSGIAGVAEVLEKINRTNKKLLSELRCLTVQEDRKILVSLRGRRTRLLIDRSEKGFLKLDGALKVLDGREIYPEFLDLTKEIVLIR